MFSKLFGKRKKYPHNKRGAPAAVYAGPEYFAKRQRPVEEEEVLDVYAGPEYFGGPPEEPTEEPTEEERFDTIYGGPPLAPEKKAQAARGGRVYAGPEYFKKKRATVDDAIGVYAGPSFTDRAPMAPPQEAPEDAPPVPEAPVYAGPEKP